MSEGNLGSHEEKLTEKVTFRHLIILHYNHYINEKVKRTNYNKLKLVIKELVSR